MKEKKTWEGIACKLYPLMERVEHKFYGATPLTIWVNEEDDCLVILHSLESHLGVDF